MDDLIHHRPCCCVTLRSGVKGTGGGQKLGGVEMCVSGASGRKQAPYTFSVTWVLPGISKSTAYSSVSSSWVSAGSNMLSVSSPVSMSSSELPWRVSSTGNLEVRFFLHTTNYSFKLTTAKSTIRGSKELALSPTSSLVTWPLPSNTARSGSATKGICYPVPLTSVHQNSTLSIACHLSQPVSFICQCT